MKKILISLGAALAIGGVVTAAVDPGLFSAMTNPRTSEGDSTENEITYNIPCAEGSFYKTDATTPITTESWVQRFEIPADGTKPGLTFSIQGNNMACKNSSRIYISGNASNANITGFTLNSEEYYIYSVSYTLTTYTNKSPLTYTNSGDNSTYSSTAEGYTFTWICDQPGDVFPEQIVTVNSATQAFMDDIVVVAKKYGAEPTEPSLTIGADQLKAVIDGSGTWAYGSSQSTTWYATLTMDATETLPSVMLAVGNNANNMTKVNGDNSTIQVNAGRNTTNCAYNFTASDDWYVSGYSFRVKRTTAASATNVTITAGGQTYTITDDYQKIVVEGISDGETATFSLNDSNKGVLLTEIELQLSKPVALPDDDELEIGEGQLGADLSGLGTWANGTRPSAAWFASVTMDATETLPSVMLAVGSSDNNMTKVSDDDTAIEAHAGLNTTNCKYNFTAGDDWFVSGYSFRVKRTEAASGTTVVITANDRTINVTDDAIRLTVTGFSENNPGSFTLNDGNKGVILTEIKLQLSPITYRPIVPMHTYDTGVPYRIPALTRVSENSTKNANRLILAADYRHNKQDIGRGDSHIDLHVTVSDDNGVTWSEPAIPVNAEGNPVAKGSAVQQQFDCGFSDPVLVNDRESGKILLTSCSGSGGFFSSDPDTNPSFIAMWTSEDGGDTWSNAKNQSDKLYGLFSELEHPVKTMFFGSGRMVQSKRVKVGDYYRIYGVISGRQDNGNIPNWVLYSDDFGENWSVLGDVELPPVPSAGDEPKCEELPDGSLVLSARSNTSTGRNFAVFKYTDVAEGNGVWDNYVHTNILGVNTAACNGEILIVPATRVADGKTVFVVLQSLPLSNNRENVGVFYKELDEATDFISAAAIASNWDGMYQVSYRTSAYSTMVPDMNGDIAFVYEEDLRNGGYNMVFRTLTLDEITEGAFVKYEGNNTADIADALRDEMVENITAEYASFIGEIPADNPIRKEFEDAVAAYNANPDNDTYWAVYVALENVKALYALTEPIVNNVTVASYLAEEEAREAYNADPTEENARHLANFEKYARHYIFVAGESYRLSNKLYPANYISLVDGALKGAAGMPAANTEFVIANIEGTQAYSLLNPLSGLYIGELPTSLNTPTQLSGTAGQYLIEQVDDTNYFNLKTARENPGTYSCLHNDRGNSLVAWTTIAEASKWHLHPVNPANTLSPDYMTGELEDLELWVNKEHEIVLPHEDAVMRIEALEELMTLAEGDTPTGSVVEIRDGKLVALREGQAKLVALLGPERKEAIVTVVNAPLVLGVAENDLTLKEYQTARINAINTNTGEAPADNFILTWTSSDESVATVSDEGVVTALKPGSATITVSCEGQSAEVSVTVEDLFDITMSATDIALIAGKTVTLSYIVTDGPAPEDLIPVWSSSDESVATVNADGVVTGVAEGMAEITVTLGNHQAVATVEVTQLALDIQLSLHRVTTVAGFSYDLTVTLEGDPSNDRVEWSSSNPIVASLVTNATDNHKVRLNALNPGRTVITVSTTDGSNLKDECEVFVCDYSGIDAILIDGVKCDIYNLNGVRMRSELDKLPTGTYILRAGQTTVKLYWNR